MTTSHQKHLRISRRFKSEESAQAAEREAETAYLKRMLCEESDYILENSTIRSELVEMYRGELAQVIRDAVDPDTLRP